MSPCQRPVAPLLAALRSTLSPAQAHTVRAVAAALLALWVAFRLELPTPYSAATTVLIVAHPVHGMVLSKSLYRLAGTLVGAAVAVVLMGCLGQQPELFLLALSLWMGLCTAVSTLLHNFRSYGAVLAGYTVALICLPIADAPQTVFDAAVNRVSVVGVGIACSALVASLTTVRSARKILEDRLGAALAGLADYIWMALSAGEPAAMTRARRKLAADLSGLDALAEYAAIETGEQTSATRSAVAAMLGAMTIATSTHGALARRMGAARADGLVAATRATVLGLSHVAAAPSERTSLADLRAELEALGTRVEAALDARDRARLAVLDRLGELLDELALCLDALAALRGGTATAVPVPRRARAAWGWAGINGLRATVAVWLAGALWILTAWPAGAAMVAMIVPNVGLLSLRDRPAADAVDFVWGTLLAAATGFLCLLYVLSEISGFPLLALVLGPILGAAVMLSMAPRTAFIGVGFYVFFITLLAPSNPMTYDPEGFLANALASLGGAVLTSVVYRLVLPVDPRQRVRALVRAIRAELTALATAPGLAARGGWEARMHDRLSRLGNHLRTAGVAQDAILRGGFAALRIGREILRLRGLALDPPAAMVVGHAMAGLGRLAEAPHRALRTADEAARWLIADGEPGGAAPDHLRAAASLTEIAILLGRHRRFFQLNPRR